MTFPISWIVDLKSDQFNRTNWPLPVPSKAGASARIVRPAHSEYIWGANQSTSPSVVVVLNTFIYTLWYHLTHVRANRRLLPTTTDNSSEI
jgi:hypothetical protein